jgi:hypothetical protein
VIKGDDRPPKALRESPAARAATLAGYQAIRAFFDDRRTESLNLADAKTENPRGLNLCQPAF